ncbi:MAG: helix-turn-helix transcriptional regulator [Clostridia bacterium]|nr:helix-turn-helix transcriptional regulator [Clostridia bacterium]
MYDVHHRNNYRTLQLQSSYITSDFGFGEILPDDIGKWAYSNYPNHHDTLELRLVASGTPHFHIDGRDYDLKPGDVIVLNPFVPHYGTMRVGDSANAWYRLYIELAPLLGQGSPAISDMLTKIHSCEMQFTEYFPAASAKSLADVIQRLNKLYSGQKDTGDLTTDCLILACVWEIFALLLPCCHPISPGYHKDYNFIRIVEKYILDNYTKDISTRTAAAALGYADSYFARLFKANYNRTFASYLLQYRIRRAAWDQSNRRNISISEIASSVGFSDYNYFSRAFRKELNMSPTEWLARRCSVPGQVYYKLEGDARRYGG